MVRPKNNMLRKKLYRDMSRAAMQFLSIIALCALGTFAFSALDGTQRMIRTTLNTYYEENNLADFWYSPHRQPFRAGEGAALPDVKEVCARASTDLDTTLPGDVSVSVTVYDGEMTINKPLLREGELLEANDPRGCLVEERFAQSKGLSLGDRLTVKLNGQQYPFTIRGIVVSPEYIVVTDGMAANPDQYGFILVNSCSHSGTAADADCRHHGGRHAERRRAAEIESSPAGRAGRGPHRAYEHGARQQRRADV